MKMKKSNICEFCGKVFAHPWGLLRHGRTHTGEKPFECDFCSQRFSRKSNMKEHRRMHTGEKPYKCDLCRLQFRYYSNLWRHRLNKHRPNDANKVAPQFKARQTAAKTNVRVTVGTKKAALAAPVMPEFTVALSNTIASLNSSRLEDELEDEVEQDLSLVDSVNTRSTFAVARSDEVSNDNDAEENQGAADFDLQFNDSFDVERAGGQNGVAPVEIAGPALQPPLSPRNPLDVKEILAKIIGYLAPMDRLKASLVHRSWNALISQPWNDKQLDSSEIPPEKLGDILERCKNIESLLVYPPASQPLEKQTRRLFMDRLARGLQQSLSSLKLYDVRLTCSGIAGDPENRRPAVLQSVLGGFFVYARLKNLQELIWHDVACLDFERSSVLDMMFDRCRSLKRLQLTDCDHIDALALFQALRRMPQLECLALGCDLHPSCSIHEVHDAFESAVTAMSCLRELCLLNSNLLKHGGSYTLPVLLPRFCNRLLQLEVLVVTEGHLVEDCYRSKLAALPVWLERHPKLKILLFSARSYGLTDYDVPVAPRVCYANGLDDPPVSYLNAFIDGAVAGDLLFSPQSPAGKIWPINEPLSQYLEKREVEKIFFGSWTYEIIRSAAKLQIDLLQLFEED